MRLSCLQSLPFYLLSKFAPIISDMLECVGVSGTDFWVGSIVFLHKEHFSSLLKHLICFSSYSKPVIITAGGEVSVGN